jgi:hypothetical protein
MTTSSSNTDVYAGNDTDAHFRQWGKTISDHLQAVGLVQTADSGQVNWSTVSVPGNNSVAGYEIYAMADSLDATYPIRIKIEYGLGAGLGRPNTWLTVGTGTNGSGSITGLKIGPLSHDNSNNINPTTVGVSRCCRVDGFVGVMCFMGILSPGSGNSSQSLCRFIVTRTVDDSGEPTGDGFFLIFKDYSQRCPAMYLFNRNLNITSSATYHHTFQPGPYSSSLTDDSPANYQAFSSYLCIPKMRPVFGVASTVQAEVAAFSEYSVALVGITPRNYMNTGNDGFGDLMDGTAVSFLNMGMLWE